MSEGASLPVRIGDVLAGKYQVERVLGAGAMGLVVAARHLDLHELRAIKLMLPSALADAEAVQRFLREARAAARLKSDHVAKIHDVGRLETGFPYIVLELLEGTDLKSLLERERVLPVERAARYMAQACDAVGEAHARGIVHRDLKPANMFLTTGPRGEERVKVLDFGIAKVAEPEGAVDVTRTTTVLGSPLFMSPEQMRSAKNADARSDVWALGVILYNMCTGCVPFPGTTITEVCSAVCSDTPIRPRELRPDIPPAFEALILRCLEKNPALRFANANELGAALTAFAWRTTADAAHAGSGTVRLESASRASMPSLVQLEAPMVTQPLSDRTSTPSGVLPVAPAMTQPMLDRASVPSAPALETPVGGSTDRATSWAQPVTGSSINTSRSTGQGAPAAKRPSRRAPALAASGLLLVLGGLAWITWRYVGATPASPASQAVADAPAITPTATTPAAITSTAATPADPPVVTTTASGTTATAPPTAAPLPSATAIATSNTQAGVRPAVNAPPTAHPVSSETPVAPPKPPASSSTQVTIPPQSPPLDAPPVATITKDPFGSGPE